jgi:hypothetical protein
VTAVLVLVPRGFAVTGLPEGVMFVPFQTAFDAVVALKASDAPAVLVTDGLDQEDLDSLASVIRERGGPCIEVRSARWDGETQSPVSAACRGVISGFGANGVRRAAELLAR